MWSIVSIDPEDGRFELIHQATATEVVALPIRRVGLIQDRKQLFALLIESLFRIGYRNSLAQLVECTIEIHLLVGRQTVSEWEAGRHIWRVARPHPRYSRRAERSMCKAKPSAALESSLVSMVNVAGRPRTDTAPWVRYLNSPGFGARSVAAK